MNDRTYHNHGALDHVSHSSSAGHDAVDELRYTSSLEKSRLRRFFRTEVSFPAGKRRGFCRPA
jgi:hypothetical protein